MKPEIVRLMIREDAMPDPAEDIRPEIDYLFMWLRKHWWHSPRGSGFGEDQAEQ